MSEQDALAEAKTDKAAMQIKQFYPDEADIPPVFQHRLGYYQLMTVFRDKTFQVGFVASLGNSEEYEIARNMAEQCLQQVIDNLANGEWKGKSDER